MMTDVIVQRGGVSQLLIAQTPCLEFTGDKVTTTGTD